MRVFVCGNDLCGDDGAPIGRFSGHWAAVAAMIRLHDPSFRSLGRETPEDASEELRVRLKLSLVESHRRTKETPRIA